MRVGQGWELLERFLFERSEITPVDADRTLGVEERHATVRACVPQ